MIVGDSVPTSRQRGGAALGDGFPRQCAHWLGMTGAKRRGDVGIVPPTKSQRVRAKRADRVVRPYKGLSKIPARDVEDAVPYGMAENGADRVVRPCKRTVKGRR